MPAVEPVPVVRGAVSVERDTDLDAEFPEHVEMPGVQLDAIRVNAEIEFRDLAESACEFRTDVSHANGSHEKRFAAVKDHGNGREFLLVGILRESPGDNPERFLGNKGGSPFPALVRMLVDITVITGEVASTVDLENQLLKLHLVKGSADSGLLVPRTPRSFKPVDASGARGRAHRAASAPPDAPVRSLWG
ncbi:hypothetical protein GCM10023335_12880 [Streptomyces siamensis]|uniref:Uncharacterized protein n=1 Tax=Streptomyces siamensis TaxID=1274986 RepID=A0ABP9IJH9_9ACTN